MKEDKIKIGVIIYHRNIFSRYNPDWIKNCLNQIENQTFQDFSIIELNFGGDGERIYTGDKKVYFYNERIDNLGKALNRSFDICFKELGFDLIFNINLDDDYHRPDRFQKQLECYFKENADIISSNFNFVNGDLSLRATTNFCLEISDIHRQNMIIEKEFNENHNVIGFPVCLFTKKFWDNWGFFPEGENSKGREDLDMWINARRRGCLFYIMSDFLFNYRVHETNISKRVNDL
jgi:hypothetical protein